MAQEETSLKQAQSALEKYQQDVAANPNSADARSNLGWGYYGLRQYHEAIREFQKATSLQPDHIDAQWGLALSLKGAGRRDEAIAAFQRALDLLRLVKEEDRDRAAILRRQAQSHLNDLQKVTSLQSP